MLLKKTIIGTFIILLTCVSALWAGDSAVFEDLGFSHDGRTYMFGQYGVLSPSLKPWAELYVIDVSSNTFVSNGRASITQNTPIQAGQDGRGVFRRLVSDNPSLSSRNGIQFSNQGLPLYISREENPSSRGDNINFRDFISERKFEARLIPTISGSGKNVRSQFYINLDVTSKNGQFRKYTVGTPNHVRQGISQYNIKRVLIDTNGSSVVFVIEMKRVTENGFDIRYMVEAVRL